MKWFILISLCFVCQIAIAIGNDGEDDDTTRMVRMQEVIIMAATPKETVQLRQQPLSASVFSRTDVDANQLFSLTNLTSLVPGFFMPDYGSKLTSAIYIRGVGSRMNTPAVGLYVDNIPYLDKSAFNFNLYDIAQIEVLRGPQSTLYGRNTMGGLIRIYTNNPFRYQGTNVEIGASSGNQAIRTSVTHSRKLSQQLAFSAGGFYEHTRGFFRNTTLNRWADPSESAGGRLRAVWLPSEQWSLDGSITYEYTDQGGYAYQLLDADSGEENPIASGHLGRYRRGLLNAGLTASWYGKVVLLTSMTSYQRLDDRMFIDQDFLPDDLYTLEQRQHLNIFTQEITLKNNHGKRWQWVNGIFASWQGLNTQSPVTFGQDGMQMLENVINSAMSSSSIPSQILSLGMSFQDNQLLVASDFYTPAMNLAVFHHTTLNNLIWPGLSLMLGLRLDYEKLWIDYATNAETNYLFDFQLYMPEQAAISLAPTATTRLVGQMDDHYVQLLPKIALQYTWNQRDNVYTTVSRGYRSGGYNIQMFADLVQSDMQNQLMKQVKDGLFQGLDILEQDGSLSSSTVSIGKQMMETFIPISDEELDVHEAVYFRPEYSWNYEVGMHLTGSDGRWQADVAAFFISTRDQQLSRFVTSGLGRIMVNANRSRSLGFEASFRYQPDRHFRFTGNYGYTRAEFRDYNLGTETDCTGNTVPFTPRHTLDVSAAYTAYFPSQFLQSVTFQAGYAGIGSIYWTEQNDASQPFYGLWRGEIEFHTPLFNISLWARNLSDKAYHTFYFETSGNSFIQRGAPRQFGINLHFLFN